MTQRLRLGDLLVASKLVTEAQIAEALVKQKETGRRLGETLVAMGLVTELQVVQTLSHQLSVPWVNLHHVDFSRELLNLVTPDVAVSSRVVPIYVRRVRQQGDVLFVATDDPLNEAALLAVASHVGMPVKAMVASALDVRNALRVYYGREVPAPEPVRSPLSAEEIDLEEVSVVYSLRPAPAATDSPRKPSPPPEAPQPTSSLDDPSDAAPIPITKVKPARKTAHTPADTAAPAAATAPATTAPRITSETAAAPEIAPGAAPEREPATPAPATPALVSPAPVSPAPVSPAPMSPAPAAKPAAGASLRQKKQAPTGPRMLTLTLLDGTTVKLPAPTTPPEEEPSVEHHLTSRDLISALLLHAEGKDVSAVLRDAHWETLFATLLSLMLKKGLFADWEFVEEWTKMRRSKGA